MEVAPRTLFTEVIRLVDEEAGINWTQPAVADPPGLIKQAASSLATLSTSKGGAKQQRGRLDNLIQATAASVTAAGRASLAKDASSVAPASTAGGVGAAAAGPSKARCGCKFGGASGLSSTAKGKGKDTLVDLTPPPSEDGDRDDHGSDDGEGADKEDKVDEGTAGAEGSSIRQGSAKAGRRKRQAPLARQGSSKRTKTLRRNACTVLALKNPRVELICTTWAERLVEKSKLEALRAVADECHDEAMRSLMSLVVSEDVVITSTRSMSRFGRALADVVGGEVNEVTPAGLVAAMETFVRTLLPKTYAAWESGPSTSCRSLRSNDPTNRTRARLRKLSDGEVEEVDT